MKFSLSMNEHFCIWLEDKKNYCFSLGNLNVLMIAHISHWQIRDVSSYAFRIYEAFDACPVFFNKFTHIHNSSKKRVSSTFLTEFSRPTT